MNIPEIRTGEDRHMISVVGGGGKTTLVIRLAMQLAARGKRVVVVTTTHMMDPEHPAEVRQYPENLRYVLQEDADAVEEILRQGCPVLVGIRGEGRHRSIGRVSDAFFQKLRTMADVMLVEADGSRRKPVKVPKPWEPVIPEETDLTIAVMGLGALGKKISEVCFNPDHVAGFLGKSTEDPVTEEDMADILSREGGLTKDHRGDYLVLLNQADDSRMYAQGERIAAMLRERGVQAQIVSRRERVAWILTASGSGSRFRGNKLLAELEGGVPMYRRMMTIAESVTDPVIAKRIFVTAHKDLAEAVRQSGGWQVVENEDPGEGIAGSVRRGVLAAHDCDAYLFCVCDQPGLRKETAEQILRVWQQGTAGIVSARCEDRPANPKLFSAGYREELLALAGDRGGSVIARRHEDDVCYVSVDERQLRDIDTREQLELYLQDTQYGL